MKSIIEVFLKENEDSGFQNHIEYLMINGVRVDGILSFEHPSVSSPHLKTVVVEFVCDDVTFTYK